jgi:hypothetical protein
VQGSGTSEKIDWVNVWSQSEERRKALEELEAMNKNGLADPNYVEDTANFATSHWFQFKVVTNRMNIKIWRSPVFFLIFDDYNICAD